ncbi:cholecystokinin receptor-like [Crassostrea virginica]|uniref:Gastrin/cholecystokinin type B receptor n=1 Tax=Crassostrea virginica TaxID=6565 RepID=A0A8B8CXW3_CRAVI|nr:cholecystokinin receptor-like [Crassostrea virginica]
MEHGNQSLSTLADFVNDSISPRHNRTMRGYSEFDEDGYIRISLYSLIFVLSVVGNGLVILTLVQNHRMRTVTNVFLLNLSVSDLLLAVLCMPFTIIPQLMRKFIFGEIMCVTIRYFQAVSVGVSCFTLVTISSERYFAIVEPLRSRRWQTRSHSYKCIMGIWLLAFILMIPIAASQEVIQIRNSDRYSCREIWSRALRDVEILYSVSLCVILFVIPMFVMMLAYGRIAYRLWADINQQVNDTTEETQYRKKGDGTGSQSTPLRGTSQKNGGGDHVSLRPSNLHHSVSSRRRVIRMLFVIVLEYFVCWTPLYVCSTWKIIHYQSIHERVSNLAWSMMLLLAYVSSFVHPVTYCFMNKNFRKGFVSVFKCFLQKRLSSNTEMSNLTANSSPTVRFQTTEYTRVQSVE